MSRWLAGVFDPHGQTDPSRLYGALAPHASTIVAHRPLQVAYSGPAAPGSEPLCLFDGFLDNASELSAALQVRAGASPEELLAAGWRAWGRALPARMRGDFALLIWDYERREGLLARDQLGVRSIFLHESSGVLYFAGEIRHLLALLPRRPAPDPVSVAHWLTMSLRPGSATLYAGVRRLNPGAMLLLDRDGVREEPYWQPRFAEPLGESEPQLSQEMRAELDRAVRRRIDPDGLTGVLMSGGLDSSSVAAVASTQAPGRVAAYSGVFPEHPAVDESMLIDELRRTLDLPGITAEVRAGGLLASAVEYVQAWDMPPVGWGEFWMLPLMRAVSQAGVETVLGGTGGDELFGPRLYLLADRLRAGGLRQVVDLARELPGAATRPRREVAEIIGRFALLGALPYRLHRTLDRPMEARRLPDWLRARAAHHLLDSDDPHAWKRLDGPRWWANIAHGLTRTIEETSVFAHQRRRSASAGLETRHPLFDLDLIELGLRQPPRSSFARDHDRPVLRAAMAGLLPDAVRLRPEKAWFDSLIADCLAGPDGASVRRLLTDPDARLGAYVDVQSLDRALYGGGSAGTPFGSFQWMHQVWRLTSIECWLREQADPGCEVLPGDLQTSETRVIFQPAAGCAA
jgi:asparagine synthase (glutamine-hydrolysing)